MNIIAGKYKNKKLHVIKNDYTRPTMQMVKEAIFNMILPYLLYENCLDLFAGTGNLGFEALSRGYKNIYLVDNNKEANIILNKNKNLFLDENIYVYNKDYMDALELFKSKNIKFDLIFLDPPYKLIVLEDLINNIYKNKLLSKDGIIVLEYDKNINIYINLNFFDIIKEKTYGIRKITIIGEKNEN